MNLYQPTITGSLSVSGSVNISGSISIAGGGTISGTASIATTALTASSADNFLTRGTLTAQTLVVQTVTSSIVYSSGSNIFGNNIANTQTLTGSVTVTGSLAVVTNGTEFQVTSTGANIGNALTDSHVISGSLRVNPNGLFVSSSGFVGMGTIIPRYALDVQTSSGVGSSVATGSGLIRAITSGTGDGVLIGQADSARSVGIGANQFKIYGDDYAIMTMGASPLYLATSGSTRLTVTSTGNIQIDNGQLNTPKSLYFQANSSAGGNLGSIDWYNVQWDGFVRAQIKGETDSALSNGRLVFSTGAGGVTERMRITSTGNIGVGTTTTRTTSGYTFLAINNATNGGYVDLYNAGTLTVSLGAENGWSSLNAQNGYLAFYTVSTERMRMTSGGNLYIGTTAGDGYKLQISGNTQAQATFSMTYVGVAAAAQWVNSSGAYVMGLDGAAGSTERLRITSGGSVVIQGVTIPQNYINLTDIVSQTDSVDQWPVMSFSGANGAAGFTKSAGSYDWGVIKGGTSKGYYGRVLGAFHGSSTIDQGFVTSGWTMQFVVNGSNGNAFLRGTLTQGSDARIKANVSNLNYGLAEVMQLRAVSYNKKIFNKDNDGNILSESVDTENKYIGFIAQEVKPIIPEVVNGNENSENPELGLSIEYQNMTALLVKAIQELKAEFDEYKTTHP